MKAVTILLGLFFTHPVFSQDHKDTTFSIRSYTCSCKYNFNKEDDNSIFDRNGEPAYYPGGEDEWKKFLRRNMDGKIKGSHQVQVRFEVDKNGDLSDFVLLSKAPNQKFEEILRVLKLSGKWFPSRQKGFCVKSYVRLSFQL